MRSLLLATVLTSTLAVAHESRVLGFVTLNGAHPNPLCGEASQPLGHVTLDDGQHQYELPLTCASAPAVAFAADVPDGRYRVRVTIEDLSLGFESFTLPTTLVVGGHSTLVTLDPATGLTSRTRGLPSALSRAARP